MARWENATHDLSKRSSAAASHDTLTQVAAPEATMLSPRSSSRPSNERSEISLPSRRQSAESPGRASRRPRSSFIEPQPEDPYAQEPFRQMMAKALDSRTLDVFVAASTFTTLVIIIMDTNARAAHTPAPRGLEVAQLVFLLLQFLEFSGHVFVERSRVLHRVWNVVDLFVITGASFDYVMILAGTDSEFGMVRMLRLVRVVRLLKAFCRLPLLRELRKLVMMVGGCMKTLFWSALLLALAMTIWSIVVVEALHPVVSEMGAAGAWAGCERCPRAFSSVFQANLTLFSTIVAGDSWGCLAVPIIEAHPWTAAIFAGTLLTLVFGILNLIVAVVVDTFAEARSKDVFTRAQELVWEERQEKKMLAAIFANIDSDQSGTIELGELMDGAKKSTEFANWLRVLDVDSEDLQEMFHMRDPSESSSVDLEQFVETMYRLKNAESKTITRFMKQKLAHLSACQKESEAKLDDVRSTVSGLTTCLSSGLIQVSSHLAQSESQIKLQLADHQAAIRRSLGTTRCISSAQPAAICTSPTGQGGHPPAIRPERPAREATARVFPARAAPRAAGAAGARSPRSRPWCRGQRRPGSCCSGAWLIIARPLAPRRVAPPLPRWSWRIWSLCPSVAGLLLWRRWILPSRRTRVQRSPVQPESFPLTLAPS